MVFTFPGADPPNVNPLVGEAIPAPGPEVAAVKIKSPKSSAFPSDAIVTYCILFSLPAGT